MFPIIGVFELPAGFEDGDAESGFGEALGGPSAGCAGSDDDDVEGLGLGSG